jgi:predicted transporter
LYFILGAYFLMVALFIPNIVSLSMEDMKPINIVSVESIVVTLAFIIVVIVLGLLYWRKNTLLK